MPHKAPPVRSRVTVCGRAGTVGPTKGDVEDRPDEGLPELRSRQRAMVARACAPRCGTLLASPIPPVSGHAPLPPPRTLLEPPSVDVAATESLAAVDPDRRAVRSHRPRSRLRTSREQIRRTGVTVAVVGEFKKGKSSLVNALVNAEVCPADPVYATVAPIVVRHGEELTVTVERRAARRDARRRSPRSRRVRQRGGQRRATTSACARRDHPPPPAAGVRARCSSTRPASAGWTRRPGR